MIIAGNSTSQVIVETEVGGGGSAYTYIKSEVNGQSQALEATGPGRYELKLEASPAVSLSPLASPASSSLGGPEPAGAGGSPAPAPVTLINQIKKIIAIFISKLFRF